LFNLEASVSIPPGVKIEAFENDIQELLDRNGGLSFLREYIPGEWKQQEEKNLYNPLLTSKGQWFLLKVVKQLFPEIKDKNHGNNG